MIGNKCRAVSQQGREVDEAVDPWPEPVRPENSYLRILPPCALRIASISRDENVPRQNPIRRVQAASRHW